MLYIIGLVKIVAFFFTILSTGRYIDIIVIDRLNVKLNNYINKIPSFHTYDKRLLSFAFVFSIETKYSVSA